MGVIYIYIYIMHIGDILGLYRGYIRAQGNPVLVGQRPFLNLLHVFNRLSLP